MTQPRSAGRSGHRWRQLQANLRAQHLPCWLCGQPIDYRLTWPDPASFSVDHAVPRSVDLRLAEDPANLRPAHLRCNTSRGPRTPKPALGTTSRPW
jgi:5-methylcytosine-specific restriction endonuclease McrA